MERTKYNLQRDFKGIWIPKEIWLCKDLTLQEKIFFIEIHSLDNKDGCFASNSYFSNFFNISRSRVSQIINSLIQKTLITVEILYKNETKEIDKRVLRISTGGIKKTIRGYLENYKGGYLENYKGNNIISINNINNKNNSTKISPSQFNSFWKIYPKKAGKGQALTTWNKICKKPNKDKPTWREIKLAIRNQIKSDQWLAGQIANPSTWLNESRWLNDAKMMKPFIKEKVQRGNRTGLQGTDFTNVDKVES